MTYWEILRKVQAEALLWGIGTAIGELPPYFVARTGKNSRKIRNEGKREGRERKNRKDIRGNYEKRALY